MLPGARAAMFSGMAYALNLMRNESSKELVVQGGNHNLVASSVISKSLHLSVSEDGGLPV